MHNPSLLIQLIDAICVGYDNPDYWPVFENGVLKTTFCNKFVNDVAQAVGCHDFIDLITHDVLNADDIIRVMESSPNWVKLQIHDAPQDIRENDLKSVQVWANQGFLTIAALRGSILGAEHGHVCIVRPGIMKTSGKWGEVPVVANVGKEMFIGRAKAGVMKGEPVGVNESFVPMPKFYSWQGNEPKAP